MKEMRRYRKRPVIVQAIRWKPNERRPPLPRKFCRRHLWSRKWQIMTLEGWVNIEPGDWIVRGTVGELYPVKHHVFKVTFDESRGEGWTSPR